LHFALGGRLRAAGSLQERLPNKRGDSLPQGGRRKPIEVSAKRFRGAPIAEEIQNFTSNGRGAGFRAGGVIFKYQPLAFPVAEQKGRAPKREWFRFLHPLSRVE
jgi:hypothetical protein